VTATGWFAAKSAESLLSSGRLLNKDLELKNKEDKKEFREAKGSERGERCIVTDD